MSLPTTEELDAAADRGMLAAIWAHELGDATAIISEAGHRSFAELNGNANRLVRALRARHPEVPAVCYVNTSAAVKAECDVCCTSANAVEVVERLGAPAVILVPDEYALRDGDLVEIELARVGVLRNRVTQLR